MFKDEAVSSALLEAGVIRKRGYMIGKKTDKLPVRMDVFELLQNNRRCDLTIECTCKFD
jgi:hypothetical protein